MFAGAAAATAKRITGMGAINADGLDLTTRGNWQKVYGKEAVYLVQDSVAKGEKEEPHRYLTADMVVWPGRRDGTVIVSDDQDLLQSVVAPGKRSPGTENWWSNQFGPVRFLFSLSDGKPRQITIAFAGNPTFVFRDPDTGTVILEDKVTWPKENPKGGYAAFRVSGRFQLELTGEPFRAIFIDPAPAK